MTTGERLVDLSPLASATAMSHLLAITQGGNVYIGPILDSSVDQATMSASHDLPVLAAEVSMSQLEATAIVVDNDASVEVTIYQAEVLQ